jgi:hypothetical protein
MGITDQAVSSIGKYSPFLLRIIHSLCRHIAVLFNVAHTSSDALSTAN